MTINASDYIQLDRRDPTTGAGSMATIQAYGTTANTAAVTQLTSRTTGVTINNPVGVITLVSAAGGAAASFVVTNSFVAVGDVVGCSVGVGVDPRSVSIYNVAAGSFTVSTAAISGITVEQPTLNFCVHKAALV